MSKAFLKESDFDDAPVLPRVNVLPPNARNYMTAAGAARLREELNQLVERERPHVRARVGDPDARVELQKLDQRIRQIQESLRTAEIPEADSATDGIARFGSRVVVRDAQGREETYLIVGVDETEFFPDAISWLSPLAQSLLNQPLHARVAVRIPAGTRELEIVDVA